MFSYSFNSTPRNALPLSSVWLIAMIPTLAVAFTTSCPRGMQTIMDSPLFVSSMSPKVHLSMVSTTIKNPVHGSDIDTTHFNDFEEEEKKKQKDNIHTSPPPHHHPAQTMYKWTTVDEKSFHKKQQIRNETTNINDLIVTKTMPMMTLSESLPQGGGGYFSETAIRSIVKALMWRIIAGCVTFITSLRFSKSITTALSIVGSDFFSKVITMYIGERITNKSQVGRRKCGSDCVCRSLIKALLWRLFAICNTLTMAIFIAKDLTIASKIAGTDAIFKTTLMFFYERGWANVGWGKKYIAC